MRCDELQPDYLMYAIGTMKEPEYGEMRAHLERGCETCTTGLREARELAYSMGAAVDGPSPPRRLRGRVLAVTAADDRRVARPGWRLILLPAACLVLTLAFGFFWYRQASKWSIRQAETEARLRQEERSTAVLRERLAGLESAPPRAVPIFSLELVRGGADAGEPLKQLAISPGAPEVVLAVPNDLFLDRHPSRNCGMRPNRLSGVQDCRQRAMRIRRGSAYPADCCRPADTCSCCAPASGRLRGYSSR